MPRFRTVIFDCDSTLSRIEGIEELAREHKAEVARLTDLAMRGAIPLEEVYGRRLELIRPTRAQVEAIGRRYVEEIVPGAGEAVRALLEAGLTVQVLSGGLMPPVAAVGRHLGVAAERVAAVPVYFDEAGDYVGFDVTSPLARGGGKRAWIEANRAALPGPVLLVGDGATDLEARPAIDAFAAFTGVVLRPEVAARADLVIPGPSLADLLGFVLPPR